VQVPRSLVQICCYLQCSRHLFFKEAALGRPKVSYCRQSHFVQTCFYIFASFSASAFRAVNLSKVSPKHINLQSRWKRCRFWVPSGGVRPRAFLWAKPLFYFRKLMFFLKNINFTIGFSYFWALVGLWGASGALGRLLETFSGSLWSHLWSWKLSGVLFGRICVLFGLTFLLFDIPWDHIL